MRAKDEMRVTLALRIDQEYFLSRLQRSCAAERPSNGRERLTRNMIIRAAIDALMQADQQGLLETRNIMDEHDLSKSVIRALKQLT
jgi:hypothetical protein